MNAEILKALKSYIRRGDTDADLKWRLMNKLGALSMTSEDADSYLAKAYADLEAANGFHFRYCFGVLPRVVKDSSNQRSVIRTSSG